MKQKPNRKSRRHPMFEKLEWRLPLSAGVLWSLPAFDLAGTRYAPTASAAETGNAPYVSQWSVPGDTVFTGNINGDEEAEVVVGSGGDVHVYSATGEMLQTIAGAGQLNILADVTGDGQLEILTSDRTDGELRVRAYQGDGTLAQTYSTNASSDDMGMIANLVADLNHDGRPELIAVVGSGYSRDARGVAAFDALDGAQLWFYDIGGTPQGSTGGVVTVGDVTGDENLEVVFGNGSAANGRIGADGTSDWASYVWCLDAAGSVVWRQGPFNEGGFYDSYTALADLDGDHRTDIVASPTSHGWSDWQGTAGQVVLLNPADGSTVEGYERDFGGPVQISAIADLQSGGSQELLVVHEDRTTHRYYVRALNTTPGLADWHVFDAGGTARPQVFAVNDLDGDGSPEVVVGVADTLYVLSNELAVEWTWSRSDAAGLPISKAIVSEINGDGANELIVTSGNSQDNFRVNALRAPRTAQILGFPSTLSEGQSVDLQSGVTGFIPSSYSWTVTKNGNPYALGDESEFSFTPDDNGEYAVRLEVADHFGESCVAASGERFVYVADNRLWIQDMEGASPREVPLPEFETLGEPQWSQDGEWIVFYAGRVNNGQIYVVRPDGTDLRRITDGQGNNARPSFSPDGTRIAWAVVYGHLNIINFDGTERVDTGVNASHVDWSRDGTRIAFDNWGFTYTSDVFVYDVENGSTRQVTLHQPGEAYVRTAWSPDAQKLLVHKQTADGAWDVWTMDASGDRASELNVTNTGNAVSEGLARWSPDGRRIAFSALREGQQDLWTMAADGSDLCRVADTPAMSESMGDIGINPWFTIHATNAAPVISMFVSDAPMFGDRLVGQTVEVVGTFEDPGFADTHVAWIDWGDGTRTEAEIQEIGGAGAVLGSHSYAQGGVYTVTLRLLDDDGAEVFESCEAVVSRVGVQDGVLHVVGTDQNDRVTITRWGNNSLLVIANFIDPAFGGPYGPHLPGYVVPIVDVERISMRLGGGHDVATISSAVSITSIINGGDGNDILTGGGGSNILIGGAGNDTLVGGGQRDMIIGGGGRDIVMGGSGEDIVIGGSIQNQPLDQSPTHSADAALLSVLAEWNMRTPYSTRVARVRRLITVADDLTNDILRGGGDRDWFWGRTQGVGRDSLADRTRDESIEDVS